MDLEKLVLYLQPHSGNETPKTFKKRLKIFKIYCGVEQLVARWAHNPKAARSSRVPATIAKENQEIGSPFFVLRLFETLIFKKKATQAGSLFDCITVLD